MVDFIADGLGKMKRIVPICLTFLPPLIIAIIKPTLFDQALGVAGGFGEAFLNGLLPVLLVWSGRYRWQLDTNPMLRGGKAALSLLAALSIGVFLLEIIALI
jgi:tyrosine-specific transport protein